jgi:hypothetical protein
MEEQLAFVYSEENVNNMISWSNSDKITSSDLYDLDEIIGQLTQQEKYICDHLHELDETDETMNRFLVEVARRKAKHGALGQIALKELAQEYLSDTTPIQITTTTTMQQVVMRKTSNNSNNNIRPKTVRLRTRPQPNQTFKSR